MRHDGRFVFAEGQSRLCKGHGAPRIDIRSGTVKIKTKLKTPVGRLALANSIALTPGTQIVDFDDDGLLIHRLDVNTTDPEEATRTIAGPFEEHLGKTFG